MLFRLHGGNGSGKSYPVYRLLDDFGRDGAVYWPVGLYPNSLKTKEKIVGYRLPGDLFVMGKYDDSQTGGGDALDNFTYHHPFIKYCCQRFTHVIYESMMASLSNPRYFNDMEDELKAENAKCQDFLHIWLDTPWSVVSERLHARRANNPSLADKPIKLDKMLANWESGRRYIKKYEAAGRRVVQLDHTKSYEQFREQLDQGGWNP